MPSVKFAKLHPDAVIPSYAKPGDNGLDLTAISYNHVSNHELSYHNYEFGLSVEIPEGYVGLIFPRSSVSNKNLMLTNSVGVIDSSYRGPLSARFKCISDPMNPQYYAITHKECEERYKSNLYKVGDRVAQLVILPCPQISVVETTPEELSKTERGSGGFGSSGN